MDQKVIDLSSSDHEEVICISDDENQNHAINKRNSEKDKNGLLNAEKEKENSPCKNFLINLKLNPDLEKLKIALKENIQKRKSMGCLKTPSLNPIKLKTWSRTKSEKEKEKSSSTESMAQDQECTYISSDSENDLPDLDDYTHCSSKIISISDDENYQQLNASQNSVIKVSDSEDDDAMSYNFSCTGSQSRKSSTCSTDDDVTVIRVNVIESGSEDTDSSCCMSPKCKRRKLSVSQSSDTHSSNDMTVQSEESAEDEKNDRNSSESDVNPEAINKILSNKDKISNFLEKMKSNAQLKNLLKNKGRQESFEDSDNESKGLTDEKEVDISGSPSSCRHFMDMISIEESEESDTEATQKTQRKKKFRKVVRQKDSDKITSYFNVKKDTHKKCFWQRNRLNMVNSNADVERSLCGAFNDFHINTIEGCLEDEEDGNFLRHGIKFLRNFAQNSIPSSEMISRVVEKAMGCTRENLLKEWYDCLVFVHEKHPGILNIDYKHLQDSLESLNFGKRFDEQDKLLVSKAIYTLNLVILCFEHELTSKRINEPGLMRQTAGYKALSYDCGFHNVKELIVHYIIPLLHHEQTFQNETPDILPLLQRLLRISIECSSNCNSAARAIAHELCTPYCYLPTLDHKKMFIQTIQSDILRFYLVTLVLERQCENSVRCYDFPVRLSDIFVCFFRALPPSNMSTPPTTPQSDDESLDGHMISDAGYSAINIEELLMLLFEVLQCYLQSSQDKTHTTLRHRSYMKRENFEFQLSEEDKDTILRNTSELKDHILMLAPDLTSISEHYLHMIACTVDWQKSLDRVD